MLFVLQMKKNWQHIINSGNCPSINQLILYYEGKLPREENFSIENHLVECEICNEILDGLSNLDSYAALETVETEIKQQIHNLLTPKNEKNRKLILYRRLAIAASILLVITIPIMIFQYSKHTERTIVQEIHKKNIPKYKEVEKSKPGAKRLENQIKDNRNLAVNKTMVVSKPTTLTIVPKTNLNQIEFKSTESLPVIVDTIQYEAIAENIELTQTEGSGKSREKKLFIEYDKSNEKESRIITGKVTDESGAALPGVSVNIKGSTKGVVTDMEGRFSIAIENLNDELILNYIGYKQENISPINQDSLLIAMKEDVKSLDEVVVVGYGVQKESMVTGAITQAKKGLFRRKETKVEENLQGRAAGASVAKEASSRNNFLSRKDASKAINLDSLKSLAQKQIELHNKQSAIDNLNNLLLQITNSIQKNNIKEIIILVGEEKYEKALKKLKKISVN